MEMEILVVQQRQYLIHLQLKQKKTLPVLVLMLHV